MIWSEVRSYEILAFLRLARIGSSPMPALVSCTTSCTPRGRLEGAVWAPGGFCAPACVESNPADPLNATQAIARARFAFDPGILRLFMILPLISLRFMCSLFEGCYSERARVGAASGTIRHTA